MDNLKIRSKDNARILKYQCINRLLSKITISRTSCFSIFEWHLLWIQKLYRKPFQPKIEILFWTVEMHCGRSRFSWWQVEIVMINVRDFHDDRSRFYYDSSRFSLWQVANFMMADRDFHEDRWTRYYESSRFSWWRIVAFPKFWSARGASHHSVLMSNFQTT